MLKFERAPTFALFLLAAMALTGASEAKSPLIEVTDRIHGFRYVTYSDEWAFSPVSKHAVYVSNSKLKGLVRLKKAIFDITMEEAIKRRKAVIDKMETGELGSDDDIALIAGTYNAKGLTWSDTKRERSFLELWFMHRDKLFQANCDAKDGELRDVSGSVPEVSRQRQATGMMRAKNRSGRSSGR